MTLNWSDLGLNGMPAVTRALQDIDKMQTHLHSQQTLLADRLDRIALPSLLARLAALETLVSALSSRLADLEYLMSEEIMAGLGKPAAIREIVEELGHGVRIERTPVAPPAELPSAPVTLSARAETTVADVYQQTFR